MGENLRTYCIKNGLEHLLREWHPVKNGNLKPDNVTAGCSKKVFWLLPYDDPNTGKHHEFEWDAVIQSRTRGRGCPYLSGKAVWPGFNDLATTHPELTKEWHPVKNGALKPTDVTAGCSKKVFWLLPYDDPNTGKHHEFEWEAGIAERVKGVECPYLSGQAVWPGFNDLATLYPEIAKEWHPTKNGDLKPTDVTAGCNKKVFWFLPYDDPNTGKHHEFEWPSLIKSRTSGIGCPYLSGRAVWSGFNDLATLYPEIAKEWHPTKNGNLKPTDVTAGCNKKVFWVCPIGHTYKSAICERTHRNSNCSICAKENRTSFPEQAIYYYVKQIFHDAINNNTEILDSKKELDIYIPSIHTAIEYDGKRWHENTKKDITKNCECANKKLFLIRIREEGCPDMEENANLKIIKCIKNDMNSLSETIHKIGKLLDTKFDVDIKRDQAAIYSQYITRIKKRSLAVKYPEVAKEWDYKRNGNLTPEMVNSGSHMKVWWLLPYDDPDTGKHHEFEWPSLIKSRTSGIGCPYLSGRAVWSGFNDLATLYPEIAKEWHPTKNGNLKPTDVTAGCNKKVFWVCPIGHTYKSAICERTHRNSNCSICAKENRTSFPEQAIYYYVKQIFHDAINNNTEILDSKKELDIYIPSIHTAIEYDGKRWHENTKKDITKNCECANKKLFLIRIREEGCPDMEENANLKIIKCIKNDMNSLSETIHKIGKLLDTKFDVDIKRDQAAIYSQYITRIKKRSLAVKYPEVAKEWDYKRNGNLTPEMVNSGSHMKVWWLLPYDDPDTGKHHEFEWPSVIKSRTSGIGCPYLSGMAVWPGFNDLTTTHPEIAAEWHPTMNGNLTPSDVTLGSKKEVWWINSEGEAWKEKIYKRTYKTKKDKQKNI